MVGPGRTDRAARAGAGTPQATTTARTTTTTTTTTTPPADGDVEDVGALAGASPDRIEAPRPRAVLDLEAADADVRTTVHELHGPPPPPRAPRSTFGSVKEAEGALGAEFGVLLKGTEWSTEELARIHETLCTLGPVEREALRGLELRREDRVTVSDGDGAAGAVFTRGDRVDDDGQRIEGAAITFFDAAFPDSGDAVVDRQATMIVVLHEVGHALEGHPNGAALAERRGGAHVAARVADFENKLLPDEAALRAALRRLPRDRHLAPLQRALDDWSRAMTMVGDGNRTAEERAAAVHNVARAQARAEAALAALPPGHRAITTATTLVTLHAEVSRQQPRYLDGVGRRDRAEAALADRGVRLDNPKTPEDETLGALEQAFAALDVQTTPYGATAPVENFAEAYMLYKRAPATLRQRDGGEAAFQFFLTHFPP